MSTSQYFYDSGIRKWMYQILRLFSGYTVTYGLNPDGSQAYSTVPVVYGDSTFSAATILRLNTENVMPSFPMISIYISNLRFDRPRTQTPTFQDTLAVRTRTWDENLGTYLPTQGNAYNIRRMMPVPYLLQIKVDIVTSNTQQKLEILEQILPLFNPAIEIQKTDNYLDWESLGYLELQDVTWSNRSIPTGQGSDSSYDVCTLQFEAPIWMSLPAQVSKMGVIFKVIMDIGGLAGTEDLILNTRQVVTYNNYGIFVSPDNVITCLQQASLPPNDIDTENSFELLAEDNETITTENITGRRISAKSNPDVPDAFWDASDTVSKANLAVVSPLPFFTGSPLDWTGILGTYGVIRPGVSMIGLSYNNSNSEILGTITINPTDATQLLFNANTATLPTNTLPAIISVVNPEQVAPGFGLPTANVGDSYMLTSNIGTAWPYDTVNNNANAYSNDIITFDGNNWNTTFSASNNIGNIQFVYDNTSNLQYQWNGNAWIRGWYGPYDASSWRLII